MKIHIDIRLSRDREMQNDQEGKKGGTKEGKTNVVVSWLENNSHEGVIK